MIYSLIRYAAGLRHIEIFPGTPGGAPRRPGAWAASSRHHDAAIRALVFPPGAAGDPLRLPDHPAPYLRTWTRTGQVSPGAWRTADRPGHPQHGRAARPGGAGGTRRVGEERTHTPGGHARSASSRIGGRDGVGGTFRSVAPAGASSAGSCRPAAGGGSHAPGSDGV